MVIGLGVKQTQQHLSPPFPVIQRKVYKDIQFSIISRIYGWLCPIGQDLVYFFFIHYLHGILWIALTGNLFREEDGIF